MMIGYRMKRLIVHGLERMERWKVGKKGEGGRDGEGEGDRDGEGGGGREGEGEGEGEGMGKMRGRMRGVGV